MCAKSYDRGICTSAHMYVCKHASMYVVPMRLLSCGVQSICACCTLFLLVMGGITLQNAAKSAKRKQNF